MPIYEYRRPDGSTFEVQQSFSDEALTHDPETGVPVARVLHPPAVHFKTKGFYSTDYGKRKRQREEGDGSADGSGEAKQPAAEGAASNGAGAKSDRDGSAGKDASAGKAPAGGEDAKAASSRG